MKTLTTIAFLLIAIFSIKAQEKRELSEGFIINFNSEILKEEKEVYISVPHDFDKSKLNGYPVVFLTESEFIFKPFSSIIQTLGEFNEIPKCIVVGLPLNNKHLDYAPILKDVPESGNAEKMLRFISQELFSYLNSLYGIDYDRTVLWTHSGIGGLFGLNTLFSSDTTFSGFIISSPNFIFAKKHLNTENPFDKLKQRDTVVLYLTCGSLEVDKYRAPFEKLDKNMKSDLISNLKWKVQINEGRNHHTSAYASIIDGLQYYFNEIE